MPHEETDIEVPPSWLIVATARNGEIVYEAGWRHREADGSLTTMKRRLGSAWLEPGEDGKYRKRRGRPKPGFLQEVAAIVAKDRVIRTVERELADAANEAARAAEALPTFREVQKADQLGGSSIARNCSPAPWE